MTDLEEFELFSLLTNNLQNVSNDKVKNAYEEFIESIKTLNQADKDYLRIYRTLNITRIEFVSLQSLFRYEQGEKCR